MINKDLTGLLNLAYEIEGLLMLHINRGDEAGPEMKNLLIAKAETLLAGLKPDSGEAKPIAAAPAPVSAAAVELEEVVKSVEEIPKPVEPTVEVSVETPIEPVVETPVESSVVVSASPTIDVVEETADTVVATAADDEVTGNLVVNDDVDPVATVNDTLGADSQLTLDEKLSRERASDISKAFTLNDRFRFRRELFRNSDAEFRETIDVIGSMSSMEEAEDYFFNDLCWNPESDDVKDFMSIVAKHF